ncbi:uncharacterized protein BP5553_01117 [Venustampulla echinocandica]|uniref:Uncharacterized protein n=1 Tax=Venustampulla echinocandica TaxID=2656787 RepID=A0A370U040_9HELO|nr:uncharacterized protein BP5553_01117 [Venustampulla echinocandica]RDL41138.1 hypothetical protein BP5553_01117 [Venustampulla echinocandica]
MEARLKASAPLPLVSAVSPLSKELVPINDPQQGRSSLSASYTLPMNFEDRATSFFAFNFIMDVNGPSKGHFTRVLDLSRAQDLDEALIASMKAVGLASYSHRACAPSLMKNARYQYMKAIQLTTAALRHPDDVKKDSTLMAIEILALFETVTGCKQDSLKNWIDHLNGAAAVIKLRGPGQVQTIGGRRMMVQVTAGLLVNCIHQSKRAPDHIREFMNEAFKLSSFDGGPGFKIQESMLKYADLRASIREGILQGPQDVLSKALELDGVLLSMATDPYPGWQYQLVLTDVDSDVIFNGRYHVYYDYWMALMWNALRIQRIMVNQTIREALLDGFSSKPPIFAEPEYSAQYQVSTDTLHELQADILATVPQHIGRGSPPRGLSLDRIMRDPSGTDLPPVPMVGGSFLMWPLWFAGIMDIATDEVRCFVVKNLLSIGDVLGIQQAHVLAKLVKEKTEVEVWKKR